MKITQITAMRGATINRGNFNNEKIEICVTVQVEDGEDADQVHDRAMAWVRDKVKKEVTP